MTSIKRKLCFDKYYNSIPSSVYNEAIQNMKFKKDKPYAMKQSTFLKLRRNKQIDYLLGNYSIESAFLKQLMIIYEPDYNSLLELNKLKFETINDYIAFLTNNADSFHIVMPFFISNHSNEKEFEDFLQSDAFNNAVTKANDNSADIAPEKELVLQSDVNENNSEKDEKTMTTNQNENNMNMLFYLGSIDNDYATLIINPMAKLENDKLIEVDLPTIKIASNFENRFTTSDAQKCYICYIDTENDIYSVEKNGKNQAQINAKKITPKDPSLEKIYEVIDISLTNTNMDQFRRKKPYYLSSYDTPVTDRIFIENGEYLYGPFIWNDLNRSSDKIEIIPEVKDINNQYSIYRLKKSKVNNYVSEFQLTHSFTDSRSSKFICFDIESMTTIIESYDFIDDESLKSIFAQKMSSEQIEKSMRQSIQSKIKNMDTSLFTDERKNRMLQMSIDTFNNDDFISDFVKKALSNEDFWSEETDGVTKKIRTNLLGYINNNADEKEKFLKIEETKEQMVIYVGLSTLEYLKKGGRISSTSALLANVLNIKPVMKFGTGVLDVYQKCRGMKKSRKAMIDAMKNELETTFHDAYKAGKVYLMAASSSSEEVTKEWVEQIKEAFPGMEVMSDYLSFGLSCHIGPDGLGIGCTCKPV